MQLNHDRLTRHPSTVRRRWGGMLAELVQTTHFDWEELESLCFVFHTLTLSTRGKMSRKRFIDIMYSALDMTHTGNVDYSYKNFDPNNNSYISMEDWCKGLSVVLRGTLEEKIAYCYETYDRHREEGIKRKHMLWMLPDNWCTSNDLDAQVEVEELLEPVLSKLSADLDKGMTPADFRRAVRRQPMLLQFLGEVLPARSTVQAFIATFCPRFQPHAYSPESRTEPLPPQQLRPSIATPTPSKMATQQPQPQPQQPAALYRTPLDGKLVLPTGCARCSTT